MPDSTNTSERSFHSGVASAMGSALGPLHLDRYWRLCQHLLGAPVAFAVCGRDASPLWLAGGPATDELCAAVRELHREGALDNGPCCHALGHKRLLYRPLTTEAEECPIGIAVLVESGDREWTDGRNETVEQMLDDLAACLLEEYRLNRELDGMAGELAARYEELNLVYSAEERVHNYEPERAREALVHLVEECIAYLGVDAAVLAVPRDKLEIRRQRDEGEVDATALSGAWSALRQPLYRLITASRSSVVVNDPSDPCWEKSSVAHAPVKLVAAPIHGARSEVFGVVATINHADKLDFKNSDRKLLEVLAEQAATVLQVSRDPLTGLLNRRGFEQRLGETLALARSAEAQHALLFLDLDGFKVINDTCGAGAGDELLRRVAVLLDAKTRNDDLVARLGDDEFAVLLKDRPADRATLIAKKLIGYVNKSRFVWEGKRFDVSISVGVAPVTADSGPVSEILSTADTACRIAKQQGYNRIYLYRDDDDAFTAFHQEMQWIPRIHRALEERRFRLYAQPIRPCSERAERVPHCEILIRMLDEHGHIIAPGTFVPAAERYRAMPAVDRWVIHNTLRVLSQTEITLQCAINVSRQSFSELEFLKFVTVELERSGVDPRLICFEITETAAISDMDAVVRFMSALSERGCRFSLDDFGEGVSSFASLKQLSVQYLKIDGSLIKDVEDPVNYVMVDAINRIGHAMNLQTIAEFVEHEHILKKLIELGIDYVQGYGFGSPRPLDQYLSELGEGVGNPGDGQLRARRADGE
jgi:diguanylate cyclase (GGDEF)-like protein